MKTFIFVNPLASMEQRESTLALVLTCAQRGHATFLATISDCELGGDGKLRVLGRRIRAAAPRSIAALSSEIGEAQTVQAELSRGDLVLVRTNPMRDLANSLVHDSFLGFARMAQRRGALVINEPDGLAKAASRIYLEHVPPSMRPRTVVTRQLQTILDVAETLGDPFVLKALKGTYGRDVFRVSRNDMASLRQIAEILLREGYVIVQEFLPRALGGDLRVLVLDGEILEMDGCAAAVYRVPVQGDFRRNLDAGGQAQPAAVSETVRDVVRAVGRQLVEDGLFLCGLDFVGSKLIEINVFSPAGLWHAQELTGVDFSDRIIATIEDRLSRGG